MRTKNNSSVVSHNNRGCTKKAEQQKTEKCNALLGFSILGELPYYASKAKRL